MRVEACSAFMAALLLYGCTTVVVTAQAKNIPLELGSAFVDSAVLQR